MVSCWKLRSRNMRSCWLSEPMWAPLWSAVHPGHSHTGGKQINIRTLLTKEVLTKKNATNLMNSYSEKFYANLILGVFTGLTSPVEATTDSRPSTALPDTSLAPATAASPTRFAWSVVFWATVNMRQCLHSQCYYSCYQ